MRDVSPAGAIDRLVPCILASVTMAVADGGQAAFAAGDADIGQRLALWAVASAAVALPAMLVAFLGVSILEALVSPDLCRRLALAFGVNGGEGRGVVVVALVAAIGTALTRLAILGRHLGERMSPHMAAIGTVVVTAVVLSGCAVACAAIAPSLRKLPSVAMRVWVPLGSSAFRVAAFVTAMFFCLGLSLDALLPPFYAITATAGTCALTVAYASPFSGYLRRRVGSKRGLVACGVVSVACVACPWMFGHLSTEGQLAVLDHAPLAAALLAATSSGVHVGGEPSGAGEPKQDDGVTEGNAIPLERDKDIARRPEDAGRPNLVLIHFDALRPDHLGFAGYARKTSPVLDRFRESATWFQTAYTPAPATRFALASVFTGIDLDRIPQRRGAGYQFDLLPAAFTLAEQLRDVGYDRFGLTIGPMIAHSQGMGQGFRVWSAPWSYGLSAEEVNAMSATRTTDAATRYLEEHSPGKALFLFAHYQCTHEPYVKHAEWDFGDADVDRYDSALAYCDREIGRLLEAVDARPDAPKTVTILYSDHGELFGEHGFHEHGNSLFEPDVRVVLLVRPPALLRTESKLRTVTVPVSLIDITPTLLDLAGAPWSSEAGGTSLVPLLEAPADPALAARPIFLFADLMRPTLRYEARGVVENGFKYVRYEPAGIEQLFDLRQDPLESKNLAASRRPLAARLSRMIDDQEAARSPVEPPR